MLKLNRGKQNMFHGRFRNTLKVPEGATAHSLRSTGTDDRVGLDGVGVCFSQVRERDNRIIFYYFFFLFRTRA